MRLRRGPALACTAVAVAVAALAVVATNAIEGRGLNRTSFTEPQQINLYAAASGVLGGDADTGCLWVTQASNVRTPIVFAHATAGTDYSSLPPTVRTSDAVIARFGDTVQLGGGFKPDAAVQACASLGTPFLAWEM